MNKAAILVGIGIGIFAVAWLWLFALLVRPALPPPSAPPPAVAQPCHDAVDDEWRSNLHREQLVPRFEGEPQ